jgi:hypothetical protein
MENDKYFLCLKSDNGYSGNIPVMVAQDDLLLKKQYVLLAGQITVIISRQAFAEAAVWAKPVVMSLLQVLYSKCQLPAHFYFQC